jgi:biotin-[acetyl-CoA-carboxylase] ligase BirA-like protein
MTIPLTHLASIDSTSLEVNRRLASGESPPFAVSATTQTGGRGRRGHQWQSPEGNLYLSVAIPPPSQALEHSGLIPLKAAVLIARWVQKRFGLGLTLKWPNDLLFQGQKVGGILCETSLNGQTLGAIVIGVGVNVKSPPKTGVAGGASGCEALSGREVPLEGLGVELADALREGFTDHAWESVLGEYGSLATQAGHVWWDGPSAYLQKGFNALGELVLTGSEPPHPLKTLNSADHKLVWSGLNLEEKPATPWVIADQGNTNTKVGVYSKGHSPMVWVLPNGELTSQALATVRAHLQTQFGLSGRWPVFLGSVRPDSKTLFMEAAGSSGFQVVEIRKRPRRYQGAYPMEQIGIDRLALIEWGLSQKKASPQLLVSCGTAVTLDVITDGRHLGGYIVPGLKLGLEALHNQSGLLPQVNMAESDLSTGELGQNTKDSMALGSINMIAELIHSVAKSHSADVVVTGGDGKILKEAHSSADWVYEENLVHLGLQILADAPE